MYLYTPDRKDRKKSKADCRTTHRLCQNFRRVVKLDRLFVFLFLMCFDEKKRKAIAGSLLYNEKSAHILLSFTNFLRTTHKEKKKNKSPTKRVSTLVYDYIHSQNKWIIQLIAHKIDKHQQRAI